MLRTNLSKSSHSPSCVITTGGIIGDLCDAGANIIMLEHYDDTGNNNPIDCDTVRECIEEALYLDCSGDPIKQRLGLYSQDINAIKVAIDLGCNQFVSDKDIDHDLDMYLPTNPAKRVKNLKEPEYSGEIITREEEERLLENAEKSKAV